ncbi:MAG TPA: phosphatidate cytidylyltransferase [Terriglobales bacterium]|nr:phosphatidate cytidylyltransferase [Terriglobales bacterium]
MKRVLTAVILIPIVVVVLFRAPLWLFAPLVLGVAVLAAREYFDVAAATGFRPMRGWGYVFLASIFVVSFAGAGLLEAMQSVQPHVALNAAFGVALVLTVVSPFVLLIAGLSRDPLSQAMPDSAVSFLLLPYVGISLASTILVRASMNGALFLLFLMLLVWSGDIAAYYVGRAIGTHKMAPRISPGKSWEGALASVVGAMVIAVLLFRYIQPIYAFLRTLRLEPQAGQSLSVMMQRADFSRAPLALVIAFAVCVNVAAQVGDLVESMLKRGAGVKDSGSLLPGHGGVLDRIDALLFAAIVGWLFYFGLLSRYFQPGTTG